MSDQAWADYLLECTKTKRPIAPLVILTKDGKLVADAAKQKKE